MANSRFCVRSGRAYTGRVAAKDVIMEETAIERTYTIQLRAEPEGGYTVLVPALPPVVTYGETYEEAMANAREAIEAVLAVYREDGIDIPPDVEIRTVTIAA
jgi:antitoxin HicB